MKNRRMKIEKSNFDKNARHVTADGSSVHLQNAALFADMNIFADTSIFSDTSRP